MSTKFSTFLARNEQNLREDAGERPPDNAPPAVTKLDGRVRLNNAAAIALDRIVADSQHRKIFDEADLQRLAQSLVAEGQLQPIQVRYDTTRNVYVVIAGERRMRAAQIAGLKTLDCIIADDDIDEKSILRRQVVENALRVDLRPVEKAKAFKAVMDLEGIDGKDLAERLHIDPSTVSRTLQLLKLDDETQQKVDEGQIALTTAIKAVQKTSGSKPVPKRSAKVGKEHTIRLDRGIVITIRSRKLLGDADIAAALTEALEQGRGVRREAA